MVGAALTGLSDLVAALRLTNVYPQVTEFDPFIDVRRLTAQSHISLRLNSPPHCRLAPQREIYIYCIYIYTQPTFVFLALKAIPTFI